MSRMKKLYPALWIALSAAVFLSGCEEGESSAPTEVYPQQSGTISTAPEENSSAGETSAAEEPVQGGKYEVFDDSAIIEAFRTGDSSKLSEKEREILERAEPLYYKFGGGSAEDLEYEALVHDYIVENATYDPDAIGAFENPDKDSADPYGLLVKGKGICLGYASTFQLFMDMAEIPCITIYARDEDGEEHGWNQVCIGGRWYYVDCTWDDPVPDYAGREAYRDFFNVSEEYMKDTGHVWDTSKCHPT